MAMVAEDLFNKGIQPVSGNWGSGNWMSVLESLKSCEGKKLPRTSNQR
jgi:hypothetical protein